MSSTDKRDAPKANQGGRPRKYKSPEEFDAAVDKHRAECAANDEPLTWTGLALALGFSSRKEMDNYLGYEGFSHSVKRAKAFVEHAYEKRLSGNSPAGAIFALKNMQWSDRLEVDQTTRVQSLSDEELERQISQQLRALQAQGIDISKLLK